MHTNNERSKLYISTTVYVAGLILCAFCGIFLGHPDAHTLSGWAKDLLDCTFSGRFSQFPEYTYELRNNATNYSMLANVLMALLMYPVHAIDDAMSLNMDIYGYVFYEKLMILAITYIDVHLFGSLLDDLGYSTANRRYAKGLFMCSSIVCVATVAKGQTDAIVMLFVFIAAKLFTKKKYVLTGLMLGISLVIKPFTVILAAPVLLLLIGEVNLFGVILPGIAAVAPFFIDQIATRLLWPRYFEMKLHADDVARILFGRTRTEGLFAEVIGNVELFFATALVVCFICLYKGVNKKVKRGDYGIYPMIMYIALGAFVSATYYWFIIVLPLWILLGFRMKSRWCLLVLLLGNSLGALVPLLLNEISYHVSFFYNLPGHLWGAGMPVQFYTGIYREIIVRSSVTLFIVTQIVLVVLYAMEEDR
ncbi:MAG: hypothetical protein K6B14_01950 [Lachnospiraceae bacterium]|nr:hypothetical protein [Lachnospiraceae bacterium]